MACAKISGNFFLARVGVGIGEAALSPAAYSIITDSFPRERLGRALGIYAAGVFLGIGLSFIIGGTAIDMIASVHLNLPEWLRGFQPWQLTFFSCRPAWHPCFRAGVDDQGACP